MDKSIKSKIILYCFAFFIFLTGALSLYSFAETNKTEAIEIPPPLEGMESPANSTNTQQSLKFDQIEIYTASGKVHPFKVELALTSAEQNKGMMFRDKVEQNTGMLFLFDDSRERAFWMKNTFVSLDIIFIRSDGIIQSISPRAVPRSLKSIRSNGKVKAVLEIGGGEAERLGIRIGDRVVHSSFLSANQ